MAQSRKQATPAQRALAAQGIGKITKGGAYRSPAKIASDQARNIRRNFEKAEMAFRQAAAKAGTGSAAARRFEAHAEMAKARKQAMYSTRWRVPGQKMDAQTLANVQKQNARAQRALSKTPTSTRDIANRGKMAELEWGAFQGHLAKASYSEIGEGGWTSGETQGMNKKERGDMILHRFITAARNKGYNLDLDYNPDGSLTSESKAQVMDIYREVFEASFGSEPEFFGIADSFDTAGGSPPFLGAISAFFA